MVFVFQATMLCLHACMPGVALWAKGGDFRSFLPLGFTLGKGCGRGEVVEFQECLKQAVPPVGLGSWPWLVFGLGCGCGIIVLLRDFVMDACIFRQENLPSYVRTHGPVVCHALSSLHLFPWLSLTSAALLPNGSFTRSPAVIRRAVMGCVGRGRATE
ncbi:hypothetical protein VTK56DRAFT_2437 [Thermocarpiscus australiensis]